MDAKELIENYAREAAQRSGLHEPERSEAQAELVSHLFEAANETGAATLESAKAAIYDCDPDAFFGPYLKTKPRASFGKRFGGGALDLLIVVIAVTALTAPLAPGDMPSGEGECMATPFYSSYEGGEEFANYCAEQVRNGQIRTLVLVTVAFAYFSLMDGIGGGSLGKRAAGTVVQKTDGTPMDYGAGALRHWTKLIIPIFFIEMIVAAFGVRWSDKMAGTVVVEK